MLAEGYAKTATGQSRNTPHNSLTTTTRHVTERTRLHFVRVARDSQGLVGSSGHGTILNHDHLHPRPLLKATREGSYVLFNEAGRIQAACIVFNAVTRFESKKKKNIKKPHLQLFNGVSTFPDDETHFAGGNQDVLAGFVPVPASLHDLTEQPLRLPVGHKHGDQDHKELNMRVHTHTHTQNVLAYALNIQHYTAEHINQRYM